MRGSSVRPSPAFGTSARSCEAASAKQATRFSILCNDQSLRRGGRAQDRRLPLLEPVPAHLPLPHLPHCRPRRSARRAHPLLSIVVIAIGALIGGPESRDDVADRGRFASSPERCFDQGGDYVLVLKNDEEPLHAEVQLSVTLAQAGD